MKVARFSFIVNGPTVFGTNFSVWTDASPVNRRADGISEQEVWGERTLFSNISQTATASKRNPS